MKTKERDEPTKTFYSVRSELQNDIGHLAITLLKVTDLCTNTAYTDRDFDEDYKVERMKLDKDKLVAIHKQARELTGVNREVSR